VFGPLLRIIQCTDDVVLLGRPLLGQILRDTPDDHMQVADLGMRNVKTMTDLLEDHIT